MKTDNMTVRTKLGLAFGLLTLMLLVIAAFAWGALHTSNQTFEDFAERTYTRALLTTSVRQAVDARAIAARNLIFVSKPEDIAIERKKVEDAHKTATDDLAHLLKVSEADDVPVQAKQLIAEIARVERLYAPVALEIVAMALRGERDQAMQAMNERCRPLLAELVKASEAYTLYTQEQVRQTVHAAEDRMSRDVNVFGVIVVFGFILAIASCVLIVRSLYRALGAEPAALGLAAAQVATGNLSRLMGEQEAPPNSVLASLGQMRTDLSNIVGMVRQSSERIAAGTSQIASGNADLSQRTEEQASALQQTAATMEELGTTVRNNAAHATQADRLARDAKHAVTEAGDVVGEVVRTMKEIDDGSRRISDIIGVIDGIAFQTNILALNAAVEAARAGEQGRGFAVVAGEVRALAQRSAEAAKEIKSLIQGSVTSVQNGSVLVTQAGTAMHKVIDAIQNVSTIVGEISVSSNEQATGVSQVGEAVSQMDQVTQQNAALVEECTAAADSLSRQAKNLVGAVSVFKVA